MLTLCSVDLWRSVVVVNRFNAGLQPQAVKVFLENHGRHNINNQTQGEYKVNHLTYYLPFCIWMRRLHVNLKKITIMQFFLVVRSITGNIRKLWAHCYTMGIWDDIAHVIVHLKCIILSSTTKEMENLIGGGSCQKYIFYYKKPVSEPLSHAILISRRKHAYTTTRKTHLGHSLFYSRGQMLLAVSIWRKLRYRIIIQRGSFLTHWPSLP